MFDVIVDFCVRTFRLLLSFGQDVLNFFTKPLYQLLNDTLGFDVIDGFDAFLIKLLPDEIEDFIFSLLGNSVFALMFGSGIVVFTSFVLLRWLLGVFK